MDFLTGYWVWKALCDNSFGAVGYCWVGRWSLVISMVMVYESDSGMIVGCVGWFSQVFAGGQPSYRHQERE